MGLMTHLTSCKFRHHRHSYRTLSHHSRSLSYLLRIVSSSPCCWSWSWWGSRRCPPHVTARVHGGAAAQPGRPADRTSTSASTTDWRINPKLDNLSISVHPSLIVCLKTNSPGDEHLLLDVGQELRVILAGEVQTFSMETEDLQTVQHVEQDVRLLKLGHFLKKKVGGRVTQPLQVYSSQQKSILTFSSLELRPAKSCIWASETLGAAGRRTLCLSYSSWLEGKRACITVP